MKYFYNSILLINTFDNRAGSTPPGSYGEAYAIAMPMIWNHYGILIFMTDNNMVKT